MDDTSEIVTAKVVGIVSKWLPIEKTQLKLETDIHETGAYGDDVAFLLIDLEKQLGIDFSDMQFDRHFLGEFVGMPKVWEMILLLLPAAFLFGIVSEWAGIGKNTTMIAGVILISCWFYLSYRIRKSLPSRKRWEQERIPVLIGDLVEAAKAKRWSMLYPPKA